MHYSVISMGYTAYGILTYTNVLFDFQQLVRLDEANALKGLFPVFGEQNIFKSETFVSFGFQRLVRLDEPINNKFFTN